MRLSVVVAGLALAAPAPAAAQLSAQIDPNPDDASARDYVVPVPRTYTVRNTGDAFVGRLRGSTLGATRRQRPTIAHLAQQQFPVIVPPGTTSLVADVGNAAAGADLDLFLFNCTTGSCVQAAMSAGGTSTEHVQVSNPAAGQWIVMVDGFAVPGGTTQYDYADTFTSPALGSLATVSANEPHPAGSTWTVAATLTPLQAPPPERQLTGEVAVVTDAGAVIARAPVTFRIDTTPPDTTIVGSTLVNTRTPTFELQSSEARSTFTCAIDGQPLPCGSPLTTPALADGQHELTVAAVDPAGNTDATPDTRTFTVDTIAPKPTITLGPRATDRDRTPSVTFAVDDPSAALACRVDGGAFAPCASPFTAPELEDAAQHAIEVRATDPAGNEGIARVVFTVTAPAALDARTTQVVGGRATPSATLTHWRTGAAVRGRTVAFSAGGQQICEATTDGAGVATCSGLLPAAPGDAYVAVFGGDSEFGSVTARGALTIVSGSCTRPSELTLRVKRGKPGTGTGLRVRTSLRGARLTGAVLRQGKRRVRTLTVRGKRVLVDLRGLRAGTYTVRATIRLEGGRRVTASRRVRAC